MSLRERDRDMKLEFKIPDTAGLEGSEEFTVLSNRLRKIVQSGGSLSNEGEERKEKIKQAMMAGESIESFIEETKDVRHVVSLYCEREENLIEEYPLTLERLIHLCKVARMTKSEIMPVSVKIINTFGNQLNFSTITLRQLIILFFDHFDRIECYKKFGKLISDHLSILPENRRRAKDIECFYEQRESLFNQDGPKNIVALAQRENTNLNDIARQSFIQNSPQCRFYEITKNIYYIETLKAIPVGKDDKIFNELLRQDVKESPFESGYIGHEVAKIMIKRTLGASKHISDEWRDYILSIMGDPRVPISSTNYQKWWQHLEKIHVDAMVRWLSGLDLKLFFEIIEEHAKNTSNSELMRMFPSRKIFLSGLYDNEYIEFSRLMINSDVERFLRNNYSLDKIPQFTQLTDGGDKSLIYLRIRNAHVLEGTHNFSIRISEEPPTRNIELAKRANIRSVASVNTVTTPISHSHSPKPLWQYKVISALNASPFNLSISPQIVLSEEDYRIYKQNWGMR
jgi:hypothetical protein